MTAMTLKQQNELTLKHVELQMIEDYFSKEARDNRKHYGQKSSGQMLSLLRKYDLEKLVSVVWDEAKTKGFDDAMNKLFSSKTLIHLISPPEPINSTQVMYKWKIAE